MPSDPRVSVQIHTSVSSQRGKTLLKGHTLLYEGEPFSTTGTWRHGGSGYAKCSCGARSPILPTTAARKRWHREHKDALRDHADTSEAADLVARMKRLGLITTVAGTKGQRLKLRSEGERVLIALQKIKEDTDAVEG